MLKSVCDLLTKMKDTSELILDLAYAALIFDSKDLANEVLRLEKQMDEYLLQFRISAFLSSRKTIESAKQLTVLLHIAKAAENISNSAGDIVELLDIKLENRPFLPSLLVKGDEKIRFAIISEKSEFMNKSIGETQVDSKYGVKIISIRRNGKWIHDCEDSVVLKANDLLIVRGVDEGFYNFKKVLEK